MCVFTYVAASRGSGVHGHDDSMLELEGQGGRSVVQLDVHPRVIVARLEKHRGLKGNERIAQHNLIFSVILSCELTSVQTVTKQRVRSSEKRRRAIRVASNAQFWKRQRWLKSTVYIYVKYKDTHVHAQRHSQFLLFQSKSVVGCSVLEVRLARWKNLTAEFRIPLKITHVEKSHREFKGKVFPCKLKLI